MKRKKQGVCSMFKIFSTYICWINKKMQHLEVSGVVRSLKWSLGVKWLIFIRIRRRLINDKKFCTFLVSLYLKKFQMKGLNQEKDFRSVSGFIQVHCWVLLRPGSALFYFPINNVLIYGSLRHYNRQEWTFLTSFIARRWFFS